MERQCCELQVARLSGDGKRGPGRRFGPIAVALAPDRLAEAGEGAAPPERSLDVYVLQRPLQPRSALAKVPAMVPEVCQRAGQA